MALPWARGGGWNPEVGWLREKQSTGESRFRFESGAPSAHHSSAYNMAASHAVAGLARFTTRSPPPGGLRPSAAPNAPSG